MARQPPVPREVAVAIPFRSRSQGVQVCLVSSRKHTERWVLPKGGVERGEQASQSAVREMWEEAGLRPVLSLPVVPVGEPVDDHKPHKHGAGVPRARYVGFAVPIGEGVEYEAPDWPEQHQRKRQWVSISRAQELVAWRFDIATLLKRAEESDVLQA